MSGGPVALSVRIPDGTVTEQVWGAELCPDCWQIRGSLEVSRNGETRHYEQRCSCSPDAENWPGWDFSTYVELCYCCGQEPIKSGSRWSVFFCDECKARVMSLNRRYGQWIIPIGRHSLQHGSGLGADEPVEPFAEELRALFGSIDRLREWTRLIVQRNAGDDLSLASYLDATLGLSKQVAFDGLCDHLAEPGQHELHRACADQHDDRAIALALAVGKLLDRPISSGEASVEWDMAPLAGSVGSYGVPGYGGRF